MDRDRLRSQFAEHFYRSLDESGVRMEAIPATQLQALVRATSDGFFAVLDAVEAESAPPSCGDLPEEGDVTAEQAERVLWTGKPYLSLSTRYELTTQRLRITQGLFSRTMEEIDLVRVRDSKVTQNLGERSFHVGDIQIFTSDSSTPEFRLENVRDPMEVREILRSAYLAEQKRRGLRYREEG